MPFYETIGGYEPSGDIKTEADLVKALQELKQGTNAFDITPEFYEDAMKEALKNKKNYIKIEVGKTEFRIDISKLTQAMADYESLRNNEHFKHTLGENPRPLDEILAEM